MYIQLAQIQLREGVDERALLAASEAFQAGFVNKQKGILKRILLRGVHGSYADLVFFTSKEDAERVAEAEAASEACREIFKIMQPLHPSAPDLGVLSFEPMKTYESR